MQARQPSPTEVRAKAQGFPRDRRIQCENVRDRRTVIRFAAVDRTDRAATMAVGRDQQWILAEFDKDGTP